MSAWPRFRRPLSRHLSSPSPRRSRRRAIWSGCPHSRAPARQNQPDSAGGAQGGCHPPKPAEGEAAAGLQDRPLCHRSRCAPHGGRPQCRRGVRRHAQEQRLCRHGPRQGSRRRRGEGLRSLRRVQDPERRLLLARWRALRCRAEPGAAVPGGRVLLRGPGCRGVPGREAGRAHSVRRRKATITQPGSAASGRTTSSTSRSASPSTCRPRKSWTSTSARASAASSAWTRTARTRKSTPRASATRSGIEFNPADKTLWFTDNQVDGMGDDQPPGELNRATQAGPEFRLPVLWRRYGAHGRVQGRPGARRDVSCRRPRWRPTPPISDWPSIPGRCSRSSIAAASSRPSMARGTAQSRSARGSCSRPLKPDGTADKPQVFAEGWLTENGEYLGRPVDVAVLLDGSLLVSDDTAGAIYRIAYEGR